MNQDQPKGTVAIVGSGIIGITTALELQEAGYQVTLFDKTEPATETSYGNASFLAIELIDPQATVGNIVSAVKQLFSENAALKVTPDHLLSFIPWSIKFLKEVASSRQDKSRKAIVALNKHSINAWKSLLNRSNCEEMVRKSGYLQVWEKSSSIKQAENCQKALQAQGIECEILKDAALFEKEPALSRYIKHALYCPESVQLLDPYETAAALFDRFVQQGGDFKQSEVKQISTPDQRVGLSTSSGDFNFDKLVVCAGVWSKKILEQLGLDIPLVAERGYHLTFPQSPVKFKRLIMSADRHVMLTPLKTGMRITGFAEFANVDSKPVAKRYDTLSKHINEIIPNFEADKQQPSKWMGNRSTLPDSLPVIDLHPQHPQIGMVFGHQHLGLTQAPISAKIITALIDGDKNNQTLADFKDVLSSFSVNRF
ncbi:FAD-dependent oxidoreductase [Cocleimonas sp. KMM 6892]|uniref:NAD(P)/FAD-dependent oxidoreductase n=1 Tax=unclassified Cocleimonas TaxID=2639732 RepID=UPI002DB7200F|nr:MULTISPECIES: FAD-dependent oxidoreductase [unclassified Cocleimonas]MEB8432524.1 FAD-dependent oxidoreductase [Cocleimonas sp. KMM 6892]MEC4715383.1 FAD-dependent oxidoreductase [Cocleimonas sp. KMM 6895]MEC4744998.1 FAD-dependent oxidoreductase [Cocleimonas sp. KMM 6896]